jgi:nicotinamidase-related amidase
MNQTHQMYRAAESVLVVVDLQEKLLAKMPGAGALVHSVGFLIDVAEALNVPVRATEQYPNGLGPTTPQIAQRFRQPVLAKTSFSCCGAPGFLDELKTLGRSAVTLVGMEAHVCVAQTALDLLAAGFQVLLPHDAVSSRHSIDQEVALRRLQQAGVTVTTAEAVAFDWTGDANHPAFKAVSKLVIERNRAG